MYKQFFLMEELSDFWKNLAGFHRGKLSFSQQKKRNKHWDIHKITALVWRNLRTFICSKPRSKQRLFGILFISKFLILT